MVLKNKLYTKILYVNYFRNVMAQHAPRILTAAKVTAGATQGSSSYNNQNALINTHSSLLPWSTNWFGVTYTLVLSHCSQLYKENTSLCRQITFFSGLLDSTSSLYFSFNKFCASNLTATRCGRV